MLALPLTIVKFVISLVGGITELGASGLINGCTLGRYLFFEFVRSCARIDHLELVEIRPQLSIASFLIKY